MTSLVKKAVNEGHVYCFTPEKKLPLKAFTESHLIPDRLSFPLLIHASILRSLASNIVAPVMWQSEVIVKFPDRGMELLKSGIKQEELDDMNLPEFGIINLQRSTESLRTV